MNSIELYRVCLSKILGEFFNPSQQSDPSQGCLSKIHINQSALHSVSSSIFNWTHISSLLKVCKMCVCLTIYQFTCSFLSEKVKFSEGNCQSDDWSPLNLDFLLNWTFAILECYHQTCWTKNTKFTQQQERIPFIIRFYAFWAEFYSLICSNEQPKYRFVQNCALSKLDYIS